MTTFSERQGIRQPDNLSPNTMPGELRNRLWNIVKVYIDKEFHSDQKRDLVIECLWDKFFKKDVDNLRSWTSYL